MVAFISKCSWWCSKVECFQRWLGDPDLDCVECKLDLALYANQERKITVHMHLWLVCFIVTYRSIGTGTHHTMPTSMTKKCAFVSTSQQFWEFTIMCWIPIDWIRQDLILYTTCKLLTRDIMCMRIYMRSQLHVFPIYMYAAVCKWYFQLDKTKRNTVFFES